MIIINLDMVYEVAQGRVVKMKYYSYVHLLKNWSSQQFFSVNLVEFL